MIETLEKEEVEEIDGSPIVATKDFFARTKDGREWQWVSDWVTYECHGFRHIDEGDWKEI